MIRGNIKRMKKRNKEKKERRRKRKKRKKKGKKERKEGKKQNRLSSKSNQWRMKHLCSSVYKIWQKQRGSVAPALHKQQKMALAAHFAPPPGCMRTPRIRRLVSLPNRGLTAAAAGAPYTRPGHWFGQWRGGGARRLRHDAGWCGAGRSWRT